MTSPKPTIARMVRNRIQSVFSLAMFLLVPGQATRSPAPPGMQKHYRPGPLRNRGPAGLPTPRRIPSCPTLPAKFSSFRQLLHQFLEFPPAMFEIFELIEAGAGWSQQDGIAGGGARSGLRHRARERFAANHRDRAVQLRLYLAGCRSDQQDRVRLLRQRLRQRRIVAALVLASEDDPDAARERGDRLERGVH